MKLNLVADYNVAGRMFVSILQIDGSNNLVNLLDMASMQFHFSDGGRACVKPQSLQMCESRRKAEQVRNLWEDSYRKDGRLYDFSPIFAKDFHDYYNNERKVK